MVEGSSKPTEDLKRPKRPGEREKGGHDGEVKAEDLKAVVESHKRFLLFHRKKRAMARVKRPEK
jgi:hypothetical protein